MNSVKNSPRGKANMKEEDCVVSAVSAALAHGAALRSPHDRYHARNLPRPYMGNTYSTYLLWS